MTPVVPQTQTHIWLSVSIIHKCIINYHKEEKQLVNLPLGLEMFSYSLNLIKVWPYTVPKVFVLKILSANKINNKQLY